MNINARSAFILTKECLPHLLKTKGNIVHVSSVTGNELAIDTRFKYEIIPVINIPSNIMFSIFSGIRAFPNVVAYNMRFETNLKIINHFI